MIYWTALGTNGLRCDLEEGNRAKSGSPYTCKYPFRATNTSLKMGSVRITLLLPFIRSVGKSGSSSVLSNVNEHSSDTPQCFSTEHLYNAIIALTFEGIPIKGRKQFPIIFL